MLAGTRSAGTKEEVTAFRWNGRRWRAVSMPHPVTDAGASVSVLSRSNVWIGWATIKPHAAHWNGRRRRVVTAPGPVDADSAGIISDGRGGYWFGPFADWTGQVWITPQDISPREFGGAFYGIVRIPRTLSFLMAASVITTEGSSTGHPAIYRLHLT